MRLFRRGSHGYYKYTKLRKLACVLRELLLDTNFMFLVYEFANLTAESGIFAAAEFLSYIVENN